MSLAFPKFELPDGSSYIFERAVQFRSSNKADHFSDIKRMVNSTLRVYRRTPKKIFNLLVNAAPQTMYLELNTIWEAQQIIKFYADYNLSTYTAEVVWTGDFTFTESAYMADTLGYYDGNISLEEI